MPPTAAVAEYARERRLYLPSGRHPGLGQGMRSPSRPRTRISTSTGASILRHRPRGHGVQRAGVRKGPSPRRRIDHHPAGSQELPRTRTERSTARSARPCSALRIESAYSKEKILELYLNEYLILGLAQLRVAAASLQYFDKSPDATRAPLPEVAYLAALPKGAEFNYNPFKSTMNAPSNGATTSSTAWRRTATSRQSRGRRGQE